MGVRPFSSGSQYADWMDCNCLRCKKHNDEPELPSQCEIDLAIALAFWGDGIVSEEIAQRMGYTPAIPPSPPRYVWQCPEVEWTEEWKQQVLEAKKKKGEEGRKESL